MTPPGSPSPRVRPRLTKWLPRIGGAVAALIMLVLVCGLIVPESHEAVVTVRLGSSPGAVWAVITDHASLPDWNAEVTATERMPDRNGRETWREDYGGFPATVVTTVSEPPTRLVREILPEGSFYGSWTWELAADGDGTRLTITERGTVENPFFRGLMAFHDNSKTARDYAAALARRLGTTLTPVP